MLLWLLSIHDGCAKLLKVFDTGLTQIGLKSTNFTENKYRQQNLIQFCEFGNNILSVDYINYDIRWTEEIGRWTIYPDNTSPEDTMRFSQVFEDFCADWDAELPSGAMFSDTLIEIADNIARMWEDESYDNFEIAWICNSWYIHNIPTTYEWSDLISLNTQYNFTELGNSIKYYLIWISVGEHNFDVSEIRKFYYNEESKKLTFNSEGSDKRSSPDIYLMLITLSQS